MSRKSKINFEIKVQSVQDYLNGYKSITQISNHVGISETQVRDWVRKYKSNGIEGLKKTSKNKLYSIEIKRYAVEDYLAGKASLDDLCSKYNISSHSVLRRWIMQYNNHNKIKTHYSKENTIMIKGRKTTYDERIEIVAFCIENNDDYHLTSQKYNVSYQQVYSWVRKYNKSGYEVLVDKRGKRKIKEEMSDKDKFEAEIKLLKAQNERLKMENEFLKKLEEIERRGI